MKKKHILTVIAVAALLAGTIGAQNKPARKTEIVMLKGYELSYYYEQNLSNNCGDGWAYAGVYVENASFSEGAEKFKLPYHYTTQPCEGMPFTEYHELAEKVASYLDSGYTILKVDGLTVWLIKVPTK